MGSHTVGWGEDAHSHVLLPPQLCFSFSVLSDWVSELSAVGGSAESSGISLAVWVTATQGVHTDAECLARAADVYPQSRFPNACKQGWSGPHLRSLLHLPAQSLADACCSEPHLSLLQHLQVQQEDQDRRTL